MVKKNEIETIILISFEILVILLLLSAGVFGDILDVFSKLGLYGTIAGIFSIIAIILGIINAFTNRR